MCYWSHEVDGWTHVLQMAKIKGQVFIQKSEVNLLSTVLDTPDFFWSAPDALRALYNKVTHVAGCLACLCGCTWSRVKAFSYLAVRCTFHGQPATSACAVLEVTRWRCIPDLFICCHIHGDTTCAGVRVQ